MKSGNRFNQIAVVGLLGALSFGAFSGCLGSRLRSTARGTAATGTILANPATSLDVAITGGATRLAGDCAEIEVTRLDSGMVATSEAVVLNLTWASSGTGTFHELVDCSDLATTSQTLDSGRSTGKIYFRPTLVGTETITLTAPGFAAVPTLITVNPGAPADIILLTGGGQTAVVTQTLALPYTVELRDAYANLIPGATLTFTIQAGNGSTDVPSAVTDALGQAAVTHTLGTSTTSGQTVRVSAAGGITEDVSATATPDVAAQWGMAIAGPSSFSLGGAVGACTGSITVTQQDAYGNAVVAGAAIPLTFGGLQNIAAYTASDCLSGFVGSPEVAMGASSASYFFATLLQQTGNLTVDGATLTTGNLALAFTGKLTSTSTQAVTSNAAYVSAGDVNRDGAPDIAYSVTGSNEISILINSAGAFAAPVALALGGRTNPRGSVFVDWDRDGDLDLVVAFGNASVAASTVSWFSNDGSGTLTFVGDLLAAADDPLIVAAGDFDKNGRPDLVVARQGTTNQAQFLFGNGSGGVASSLGVAVGADTYDVVVGDFNRDGHLDAAFASGTGIRMLAGDGLGAFAAVSVPVAGNHALVQSLDWDSDGDLDLVSYSTGNIVVATNNGAGVFTPTTVVTGLPGVAQFAIADLDRDGDYDISFPRLATPGRLSRYVLNGTTLVEETRFATGTFTTSAVAVDWDRDGFQDVVSFDTTTAIFWKSTGTARPGTLAATSTTLTSGLNIPLASLAADFNRDGYPDLITSQSGTSALRMTESNGSGGYLADVDTAIAGEFLFFASGDFNRDGRLDLVGSMGDRGPGSQVAVFLGDGAGGFGAAAVVTVGSGPREILPIDLDRDGDLDLVVLNRDTLSASMTDTVSILTNDGLGVFTPAAPFTVLAAPETMVAADFNRDGTQDIAVMSRNGSLRVYIGNGMGSFAAGSLLSIPDYMNSSHLAVGDLDRDGDLDLAIVSKSNDRLGVALNDGAGTFTVTQISTPQDASGIQIIDFNQDGHLDLVYTTRGTTTDYLRVQLGTGGGAFAAATTLVDTTISDSIHFVDQNHDGIADVFLLHEADGTLIRYLANP